jgi:hypothetical protein
MNYRKIIETAIECEKLETALIACQIHHKRIIGTFESIDTACDMADIEAKLAKNHDRLKQLVEETV